MALSTRKPTGVVPWPFILVEGGEKSGKTWLALALSASDQISRTVLVELGTEGTADQYGLIPGANYEIAEHNGTFDGLAQVIRDAAVEAAQLLADGKAPMLLVIDTATEEWDLLKGVAETRSKRSTYNQKKLREDPNAEILIDMTQWNHVTELHYEHFIEPLKAFPGIVVVTARGKEVAAMDGNGRPIANTKTYKVEGQKNLAYDVSAWVQLSRNAPPTVVGMRSVAHGIRPGKDDPIRDANLTLERLIFNLMGCDPKTATTAVIPTKSALQVAKGELWTAAQAAGWDVEKLKSSFAVATGGGTLETGTVEQFDAFREELAKHTTASEVPAASPVAAVPDGGQLQAYNQILNYAKATQLDQEAVFAHYLSVTKHPIGRGTESQLRKYLVALKAHGLPVSEQAAAA